MCLAINITNSLLSSISLIVETYDSNFNKIGIYDKETVDILHELELSDLTAVQSLKLFKQLRITRKERRRAKDENETLLYLYELITKEYPKLKESLKKAKKSADVQKNRQGLRVYSPRIIEGLKCAKGGMP